jgi:hypothetical protein
MSVRRRLVFLAAFVLFGAGTFLVLIWICHLLGWIPTSGLLFGFPPNMLVLGLIPGAGIGLLVWLGFVIGRRRAVRSSDPLGRGVYVRAFEVSLLIFLALGTLTGVMISVPRALDQAAFTAQGGQGAPINEVSAYILIHGSLAAGRRSGRQETQVSLEDRWDADDSDPPRSGAENGRRTAR